LGELDFFLLVVDDLVKSRIIGLDMSFGELPSATFGDAAVWSAVVWWKEDTAIFGFA
jgi:hypothetical protein